MASVSVYNKEGKEVEKIDLNDSVFAAPVNEHLVHMAVVLQLANKRQGTQKAKTRSEVRGGGRKPWRQKGTGHARQGSIRAPQWTGGGVVFAPVPRDYSFKMNKKEKAAAMKSVLSSKVNEEKLIVVDSLDMEVPKTKEMKQILSNLKAEKALVVVDGDASNAILSVRNIPTARGVYNNSISVYDVLKYDTVVITKAEERKNKTDQLLLTAPVSLWKVVLGKYLAMVTVIGIPNVIFCAFPLIIKAQGTAYLKVDYISIGVFFLLGCVYAAIGMFLSALTESQMIAFISTFGILLILYLWNGILSMLPSSAVSGLVGVLIILTLIVVYIYQMTGNIVIAGVIEAVGVIAGVVVYFVKSSLYENLLTKMLGRLALADVFTDITSNSIVDITGIALYLSLIVVFVFLTVQAIQKRRWN